jgi:N,N'-diacetyllegionaminate synthase
MQKNKKVFIIAEVGVNHNGNVETAKKMVNTAVEAGADAVKFQTFKADKIVSKFAPKAGYQKKTTDARKSQLDMLKKLELTRDTHKELINYCREKGILFLSSPFDLDSIDLLDRLGLNILKIPSGEINNLPYLRKIGRLRKKLIVSTGMSTLIEVRRALEVLTRCGTCKKDITVLHCTSGYPAPYDEINLKAMVTMREKLGVRVGYSDHTLGIEVAIAAVTLGAQVIEKHITLDKNMAGPDHRSSLESRELKALVRAIRHIEQAFGNGIKKPSSSEERNKMIVRKSIITSRDIKAGKRFDETNMTTKRPGSGINPMKWDKVVGKIAKRDFKEDELIKL